jgi:acetoin utilization deacetylase AcuC-like enzyme
MLIYTHLDCIEHRVPSGHPERPERLAHLLKHLENVGVTDDFPLQSAPKIDSAQVNNAHEIHYFASLATQKPLEGIEALDPDTWMSPGSLDAAAYAAGAVWQGVNDVIAGRDSRVFCAVRPPGHHAEYSSPMGFCLLNSVAIAAINALKIPGINKVAILDFDVHHGNGTVNLCQDNPDILVCSSFQHPFYPGRFHEVDRPNIVNTPLLSGTKGDAFRHAITRDWWPAIQRHQPDLILLSAGFDGHRADPLAQLQLAEADYFWITQEIVALAKQYAQGRIVSALEGGYDLQALGTSVVAHLEALKA